MMPVYDSGSCSVWPILLRVSTDGRIAAEKSCTGRAGRASRNSRSRNSIEDQRYM